MKEITIKLQDHEYQLLKEVQASEFTDLATETDTIRWSIALAKLCLEEIEKIAASNKKMNLNILASHRDPFAGKGIKPVPAPSTLMDKPLNLLVRDILVRATIRDEDTPINLGPPAIDLP